MEGKDRDFGAYSPIFASKCVAVPIVHSQVRTVATCPYKRGPTPEVASFGFSCAYDKSRGRRGVAIL